MDPCVPKEAVLTPEAYAEMAGIIDALSIEERTFVSALPEADVILLHHGIGTGIRNRVRSGEIPALFVWSRTQVSAHVGHLDDMTWPIVLAVWRSLKGKPLPQKG